MKGKGRHARGNFLAQSYQKLKLAAIVVTLLFNTGELVPKCWWDLNPSQCPGSWYHHKNEFKDQSEKSESMEIYCKGKSTHSRKGSAGILKRVTCKGLEFLYLWGFLNHGVEYYENSWKKWRFLRTVVPSIFTPNMDVPRTVMALVTVWFGMLMGI